MSKFIKRIQKTSRCTENAIVVGKGFGHLSEILEIYKTVFVIDVNPPEIKSKNLVYRQGFTNLNNISEINTIFFDLDTIVHLYELKDLWQRNNSVVVIEGDDPIERDKSQPLYNSNWGCTSLQGLFHVWEKIK